MAGQRQPLQLLLLKNKKHLMKAEIEDRAAKEVRAPSDKVRAPGYLDKENKREFNRLAKQLIDVGIMSNLDVDALARFVLARQMYINVTNELMMQSPTAEAEVFSADGRSRIAKVVNETYADLLLSQDKLFKQCRQASGDLGLTISSRVRLVVPTKEEPKPKTKEERLFGEKL